VSSSVKEEKENYSPKKCQKQKIMKIKKKYLKWIFSSKKNKKLKYMFFFKNTF
jgi:hypothetical protein